MNRYYKNFILCGDIDQYCLLCKESFHLIMDIEKHIRWENHRKHLKRLSCIPKFRKDLIYKIGDLYYCELCNFISYNMASTKEHTKSDKHILLKTNPDAAEIKKPAGLCESGYVIINKVILSKAQWNSVVDDKCLICDVKVKDLAKHIGSQEHIIKLIQSQTKYANNQYYRKINEDTYHCFACKKVFTSTNFESHWVNCENIDAIDIKQLRASKTTKNIDALVDSVSMMADVELDLVEALKEFYQIDEEHNVAICKACKSSMVINFKTLIIHMKEKHNNGRAKAADSSSDESAPDEVVYSEVTDTGKKRSELAKYGRENHIKLTHNGARGYCSICDRSLSAHKRIFREHSKGANHKRFLELLGLKKPKVHPKVDYIYKSIKEYIKSVRFSGKKILVNGNICMDIDSFFLMYKIPHNKNCRKTKCFACDEFCAQGDELRHCLKTKHRHNVIAAKVVMKEGEFIREIRTNVFHCAVCNVTLPYPKLMERHLKSYLHKKNLSINVARMPKTLTECVNYPQYDYQPDTTVTDDGLYRQVMHIVYGILLNLMQLALDSQTEDCDEKTYFQDVSVNGKNQEEEKEN